MRNSGNSDKANNLKGGTKFLFINVCYLLALAAVLLPLLTVAKYDYPSADDWSYGAEAYQAIRSGSGLGTVLRISAEITARNYVKWEGRFMNAFLASLQPGIWGEQYYSLVAWLMLGGLVLGELILFRLLFCPGKGGNRLLWPALILPSLMLQILYTPSVIESFFWYTGAVNYTFVYALSLVLLGLFIRLGIGNSHESGLTDKGEEKQSGEWKGRKRVLASIAAGVLAVVVGGDNFSTSLSTLLFMLTFYLWMFLPGSTEKKSAVSGGQKNGIAAVRGSAGRARFRYALSRTWFLPVLTCFSLMICILAPGNRTRLRTNFGGGTTGNVFWAVGQSLWRSFTNIYSWTNGKVLLMLALVLPFAWLTAKELDFDFRWPGLFTLLTFGLYASQLTSTLYVDGTTGGGRLAAILYYSCHVWLVGNVCYWTGWLCRMREKWPSFMEKIFAAATPFVRRFLIPYCALAGLLIVCLIYFGNLKETSVYWAYRDWRQGLAKQYAKEWEERFRILHDESIREVEFAPLSVHPATLQYTDLQDEDGYTWVNDDCARYYGKESIRVGKK